MNTVFEHPYKKVYPIIYPIKYGQMNTIICYLYEAQDKLTLIDAGIDSIEYEKFFYERLAAYGISVKDIDQIILTHYSDDIGMVNKILKKKDMLVFAHPHAMGRLVLTRYYQQEKIQFFEALYAYYGCEGLLKSRMEKMQHTHISVYV